MKHRDRHTARLLSVSERTAGTTLTADAAAGATTLSVDDASVFDESGWLLVGSQVVKYTAIDDDAGTVTLADPLTTAADTDDFVARWSKLYGEVETVLSAQVAVLGSRDQGDELTVEVADTLDLPTGDRGGDGENCTIESDGDMWTLIHASGRPTKARGIRFEHAEPSYGPTDAELAAGAFTRQLLHGNIAADHGLFMTINGVTIGSEWWSLDAAAGVVTVTIPDWVADAPADRRSFGWPMYAYRRGLASTTSLLNIPLGYSWKYKTGLGGVSTPAGVAYDDSTWATGPSPFGWGTSVGTLVPSPMDVWTRIHVTTSGGDLTFATPTGVDNYSEVYLDGNPIWSPTYPSIGASITVPCAAGAHVIAIHGEGDGISQDRIGFTVTEAA